MNNLARFLAADSRRRFGISRVSSSSLWVRFYFAGSTATPSANPNYTLSRRINNDRSSTSVVPILDQWLKEGRYVHLSELRSCIRDLRSHRRFRHALQVSEWMIDKRDHYVTPADIAVQLDLIFKAHGLEQAEKFFDRIPDDLRNFQVYGSLLNCYTQNNSLEKAEPMMQKMWDLGFVKTYLPYNAMLKLYYQLGKYENMDNLLKEMKERGIHANRFTYYIRFNAYCDASDIKGMEKFLMNIEACCDSCMDWKVYSTAAKCYLKVGLIEKGLEMLKKSENLTNGKIKLLAYEALIPLYADAGKKDDVCRLWTSYKSLGKINNVGYLCTITSLVKLDDLDGAETILAEWENTHDFFDIRVPNAMISGYCQKGLLEKAVACVNRLTESGKQPNATTLGHLAVGYRVIGQMAKSVEMLQRAIQANFPGWKPSRLSSKACLDYLRHQGDMEAAEELLKLLREHYYSPEDMVVFEDNSSS